MSQCQGRIANHQSNPCDAKINLSEQSLSKTNFVTKSMPLVLSEIGRNVVRNELQIKEFVNKPLETRDINKIIRLHKQTFGLSEVSEYLKYAIDKVESHKLPANSQFYKISFKDFYSKNRNKAFQNGFQIGYEETLFEYLPFMFNRKRVENKIPNLDGICINCC